MSKEKASGRRWRNIQQATLEENRRTNDGRCVAQLEGCLGIATEVHHDVARIDGGTHDDGLSALCSACHTRFTTITVQRRAALRRAAKREAKRKNHPGRKDRYA